MIRRSGRAQELATRVSSRVEPVYVACTMSKTGWTLAAETSSMRTKTRSRSSDGNGLPSLSQFS